MLALIFFVCVYKLLYMLQLVFVDLLNRKIYVTQDEGVTFVEHTVPFSPDRLVFHPKQQDRILAYTYGDRTVSRHYPRRRH